MKHFGEITSYFCTMKYFLILWVAVLLCFCKSKNATGRYIAETDTTFNKDIRDISARINKDPQNAELYYKRGNTFYYLEKYKDAIIDFKTAVTLNASNAVYHNILGETYLKLDSADSRSAMEQFDKAIQLNSSYKEAKLNKGKLLLARQKYEEAGKLFAELSGQTDLGDKAALYLGICAKETKDTAAALKYFEKATIINPDNTDATLQIANLYLYKMDPLAVKYFDKVLAKEDYNYEALYGKALYYQKSNQPDVALKLYDRVREINPAHKLAIYNSAVIYLLKNNVDKAYDYCEKLLEIEARNANALALKGYCNEQRGNKKAALQDYKAALEIDPQNAAASKGMQALLGS